MSKWQSHWQPATLERNSGKREEKSRRRRHQLAERSLRIEPCEERKLLAVSPTLVAVIPNEGAVIHSNDRVTVAPRELTFRFDEGQIIDASTLSAITVTRAGYDDLFNGNDIAVPIGYVGIGQNTNDVVLRFAETLPDDKYRLRITGALENTEGDAFNQGNTVNIDFNLDLGALVTAVVPQPVSRSGNSLVQSTNTIVVYFNNDDLNATAAQNVGNYQLIRTNGTASNLDDTPFNPISVTYDNTTDKATLTFAAGVLETAGTYRLRIGNNDPLPVAPANLAVGADPGSTFSSANDLGILFGGTGFQSAQLSASIDTQAMVTLTNGSVPLLDFPGSNDEPGHRQIPAESHLNGEDATAGINTAFYNFRDDYGTDPQGNPLHNLITEAQKQRAREIFSLFSQYTGIQFMESATDGITVATGDLRAASPDIPTGPGGVAGLGGGNLAVMDLAEDWGESEFGGSWFKVAMHEIGHCLGLGHAYDLPPLTIMGGGEDGSPTAPSAETVVPGDADIVHLQHLYRPNGKDIDTYRFELARQGAVSFEAVAQRLTTNTNGWLDSVISVYDEAGNLIGRNDNYFGRDSFLKLDLAAGKYFVAITAAGNTAFDLNVPDSGHGGRSEGDYTLRLSFDPAVSTSLTDATGVVLDGDADGHPGGEYNFWFKTQTSTSNPATNRVLFVDKASTAVAADGTLARPFKEINLAFAAAEPGDIVRVVGNDGLDGNAATLGDNLAYEIGYDIQGNALADGTTLEVPQGVTLMIDAGAIFKLRAANLDVGSSAQGIDRSGGAIQVLGTPTASVNFTSWLDESTGKDNYAPPTTPRPGDWGGLVFRADSDLEQNGVFLNYVNHADIRYGGGQVAVNSIVEVYNPIHMVEARPTISFNSITLSADAAMSADPDSFEETLFGDGTYAADYNRVGPDVHGNQLINPQTGAGNSLNALFVRIKTLANENLTPLTTQARFDDTDIVHVISENLLIQGDAGGGILDDSTGRLIPRLNARLAIDPATVVKLGGARIEVQVGAQFLAEGTAANPIIFTSLLDDSYGRGGTFDTSNDGDATSAEAGQWAGLFFAHDSSASLDHVLIAYAGGYSAIEGGFATFNPVEIHQARVRIANSELRDNADGTGGGDRNGRLANEAATIFVRGAQPALLNTVIRDGAGPAISINVNALNSEFNNDPGRSTGPIDLQGDFYANQGPLVSGIRTDNNEINGMVVRGGTMTTEGVWDDTDIVHVVQDEIVVPNYHTYGGLRLKSAAGQSLVVKLSGDTAGFTAGGSPLDIDDRIGGTVQILGQPGAPVVLTSLSDTSVGAGLKPDGTPQLETGNPGSTPAAGDWRSVKLDRYSNDRNVGVVNETEQDLPATGDTNGTPNTAQFLGGLAPDEKSSDDNLRLGFEVHGIIAQTYDGRGTADPADDRNADVDVYSFRARTGTEVWLDIDRSTHAFDSILELVDANGSVIARSNDSELEQLNADPVAFTSLGATGLVGDSTRVKVMQHDVFGGTDFFTINPRDGGLRVVLPGATGVTSTYYVRVRANSGNLANTFQGASRGAYQLQVRLRETNENPGSTVQYADIRYATNGIEVIGKPENSPLLGEAAETTAGHNTLATAQDLGNLLGVNRNTLAVSGNIGSLGEVDWYKFQLDYQAIQSIPGVNDEGGFWPTVFDLDYADGMGRVNASLAVFNSAGNLVYWSRNGAVDDDVPRPLAGADTTDLSRGSFGNLDPMAGSVDLREGNGQTYYLAVVSNAMSPDAFTNPAFRLEPIAEYERIFTNRVEVATGQQTIGFTPDEFHLGDVVMFVNTSGDLFTYDPFTGAQETDVTGDGVGLTGPYSYHDIAMRSDGRLYTLTLGDDNGGADQLALSGNYRELNTGNGSTTSSVDDEIVTYDDDLAKINVGVQFEAMAHMDDVQRRVLAVGNIGRNGVPAPNVARPRNLLYLLNADGKAVEDINDLAPDDPRAPTDVRERGTLFTSPTILPSPATDTIGSLTDQTYNTPGDVLDGFVFSIEDLDGTIVEFEMDSGPDITVNSFGAQAIRDGQFITASDGIVTRTFEFDSGPVLVVASGATLVDGERFTIVDNTSPTNLTLTFEFDNDNTIAVGSVPIKFTNVDTTAQVAANVATAITNAAFNVVATASPGAPFIGRISLENDTFLDASTAPASVTVEGDYGLVNAAAVTVPFEEVDDFPTFATSMLGAINGVLTLTRSGFAERTGSPVNPPAERGDRITLAGAVITGADLAGTPALSLANKVGGGPSASGVAPGRIAIPFDASDDVFDMATLVEAGINFADTTVAGFDVQAERVGGQVVLIGSRVVTAPAPFDIEGEGPGGFVTGLAYVGDTLYAVSDQGGLYTVENPLAYEPNFVLGTGPRLEYVNTSQADLLGIPFSGLSVGPPNVEGGRYANLLFATDVLGNIYAFNTAGELQPIFHDGATSLATGRTDLQGIAFSTLDYNLWHRSGSQSDSGGASYYFGLDNPANAIDAQPGAGNYAPRGTTAGPDGNPAMYGTYNLPGGAHGSLTTDPFSLAGYTANDQPTLYFTYRVSAETNTIYDSTRIFVSTDGANWSLLTQDLVRNTGDFRQIRLDMSAFAGRDGIRLRFDFDTAGDREVGTNDYAGEILRALAGNDLTDGQTFTIDGQQFEFDLGLSVLTQSGLRTNDGDTLTIDGTVFEFNKSGGVSGGNVAVSINDTLTAGQVAMQLATAINGQAIGVDAVLDRGITIATKPAVDTTDGDTVTIDGITYEFDLDEFFSPANVQVSIQPADTATVVARALAAAIEDAGVSGQPQVQGNTVLIEEAQTATQTGNSTLIAATSPRVSLVNATTATETGTSVTVHGVVGVQGGNIPVVVDASMDEAEVAQVIAAAMDSVFVPAAGNVDDPNNFQSVKVDRDQLHVIGHHVEDSGPLPWSDTLMDPVYESTDHPTNVLVDRFFQNARGQQNGAVTGGFYLDDIIVGLAGRGEVGQFANGNTGFTAGSAGQEINVGRYDLEIRRGREPERGGDLPTVSDPLNRGQADAPVAIDLRDRLGKVFTLHVLAATGIGEGETFRISDGNRTVVFEFDSDGIVGSDVQPDGSVIARTPVSINNSLTAGQTATAVANAINNRFLAGAFRVRAVAAGGDGRVELMNANAVEDSASVLHTVLLDGTGEFAQGDQNHFRDQGYTLIANNSISDSANYNIVVDSPTRDQVSQAHPSAIRNLREVNAQRLVPGISIYNNLLVAGGDGGIHFSGDGSVDGAVPFGRIVNNTIVGEGGSVGILIDDGASPTVLNNILSANSVGINGTAGSEVLGFNIYQDNTTNLTGATEPSVAGVTNFLASGAPLFVDAANRNFYLEAGSKAIDSSRNSLDDRNAMVTVTNPLGIPASPILAPNIDLLGQTRVDDPGVTSPPGQGQSVFKDRGAIDRADFVGSTVALVNPLDNDAAGLDKDTDLTQVLLQGQRLSHFSFQLNDGTGSGISDATVTAAQITFLRDGQPVPATDFIFSYDTTNDIVRLQAVAGIFADGVYTVEFNNSATGITDIADNPLKSNQASGPDAGKTLFTIELATSATSPWQNPGNYDYATLDVNNSGFVSAIDAGIVYDYIHRNGIGPLPLPATVPPYLDVNGDGACTPIDLGMIIDHLNRRAAGTLASFESSEGSASSLSASPTVASDLRSTDVALGLSLAGDSTASSETPLTGQVPSTSAIPPAAVDAAMDDYTSEDSLESIDLFQAEASDDGDLDSLFEEVDALLI